MVEDFVVISAILRVMSFSARPPLVLKYALGQLEIFGFYFFKEVPVRLYVRNSWSVSVIAQCMFDPHLSMLNGFDSESNMS